MTAWELQMAGYYCTPNPWDVRVDFYPKCNPMLPSGQQAQPVTIETIKYQDGLSLDERLALGWDRARAHWVERRLAGEIT
jgi:hypothetical protein